MRHERAKGIIKTGDSAAAVRALRGHDDTETAATERQGGMMRDLTTMSPGEAMRELQRECAAANARADELAAQLAALRAQLAAAGAGWRPVSEPPAVSGEYLGHDADARRTQVVSYNADLEGSDCDWPWGDWYGDMIPLTHWQPLPPAPTEDTP